MKLYSNQNVYDTAKDRIRYLFDEFDIVIVSYSGGKDSTVSLELALEIAREKGKLPLKVLFLDQENEWEATIDMVKDVMSRVEIEPLWFQIPFVIQNSSSQVEGNEWLHCWDKDKKDLWVHEKVDVSIKKNVFGTEVFGKLFTNIPAKLYSDSSVAFIAGVRAEESPARSMGLTQGNTYKGITWGKTLNSKLGHYTFYPIYDWSYLDVWKSIHDNDWRYNKLYDYQYRYGITVNNMRVSSLTHSTAVQSLQYLQEVEPETYERMVKRIGGVDTAGKLQKDFDVKQLPYMFTDWLQYRDYLLENLITDGERKAKYAKEFARLDELYSSESTAVADTVGKLCVNAILHNDSDGFVKIGNWEKAGQAYAIRGRKGISKYHY